LFVKYEKKGWKRARKLSFSWLWDYLQEILMPNHHRRVNTKIYKQIKALSTSDRQFDRVYSVVLPELDDICKVDVGIWVKSNAKQFVGEDMTQKLDSEIREMFESWERETSSNRIPMEYLAGNLEPTFRS
jgi:hypothetical protein